MRIQIHMLKFYRNLKNLSETSSEKLLFHILFISIFVRSNDLLRFKIVKNMKNFLHIFLMLYFKPQDPEPDLKLLGNCGSVLHIIKTEQQLFKKVR
jgi:hypothetical protein